MNIENQVTSLELSQKLKELGVKQESLFYHYDNRIVGGTYDVMMSNWKMESAFTASELLELLPNSINSSWLEIIKGCSLIEVKPKYCVRYYNAGIIGQPDENIANACAKMLIHIKEDLVKSRSSHLVHPCDHD